MRASDLVKGKTRIITGLEEQGGLPKEPISKEAALEAERKTLRLSEIDILKLKTTSPPPSVPAPPATAERVEAPFGEAQTQEAQPESDGEGATGEKAILTSLVRAKVETTSREGQPQVQVPAPQATAASDHADVLTEQDGIKRVYLAAKQYMAEVRNRVREGAPLQIEPALIFINTIVKSPEDLTSRIYQLTVDYEQEDDFFISSPLNTMVYGLKVAQRLGYEKSSLIEFGLAGLLHDVGMFLIPEAILNKEGRLTDEEMAVIRRHPELGVEILSDFKAIYPLALRAVYEHQERSGGQGYPQGLKGTDICDFAKIIGICDSYEAMTHYRPHKKTLLQSDSIKELIGGRNNLFEPRIAKAFLDEISIYPVGSYIRLNNRNIGRVTATNKGNPMKPVIRLLYDEKGKKIEPARILDLREYPVLNIERSIAAEDIASS